MGEHREIERKYDAAPGAALPDLVGLAGVAAVSQPVQHELEATYFDTAGLQLATRGITLRRRTGGDDQGWHLKLPVGPDERVELRAPLGEPSAGVPEELRRQVLAYVRDHELRPVAELRTTRTERRLGGADGRDLAVLADDLVRASALGDSALVSDWRELEVELVDGSTGLLDAVDARLTDAGLARSTSSSKLRRALGPRAPEQPPSPAPDRHSAAADVVLAHLREQVDELERRDRAARADEPDAVHKMRVATRRLRSALATFRPLLDRERTEPLRDELRWLGRLLGEARDAEVLRERLLTAVAGQPSELVLGPVARRIDLEVGARHREAHEQLVSALEQERYFRLLDRLDALVADPPWRRRAARPADDVLRALVGKAWRRVRDAAEAAEAAEAAVAEGAADGDGSAGAAGQVEHDTRLHEVRKAAKRARYAAEAVAPAFGKPAARMAKAMERLQDVLGEHQDSVTARPVLRGLGVRAHLSGENGFTFGLLHGLEALRAREAEAAYAEAWRAASRTKVHAWTD